jgi:hemolysin activation/secretion protein
MPPWRPAVLRECVQRRLGSVLSCLALGGLSLPAVSQDAGALLREQQRRQQQSPPERLEKPDEDGLAEPGATTEPEQGQTVVVSALRFDGAQELLPEADRERIAQDVRGRSLGFRGLQGLANEVTQLLQRRGRLLARAVLPPQDITDGAVTLAIVDGRLESIELEPGAGVRTRVERLRHIADSRIMAENLTRRVLESALLTMNDHPGLSARARLTPGSAPDTSRLIVGFEQAPVFSTAVASDNYGSEATGKAQGNATVALTDLTGFGDRTRFSGFFSEGQKFGQVAFSAPLGGTSFTLDADFGYLDYHNVDDTGRALELEGNARFATLGLDYRVVRSRSFNLRLRAELNRKALLDESIAGRLQDKRSLAGTLAVHGDLRDDAMGGGLTIGSVFWTFGDLDLSRLETALVADRAGLATHGRFHRVNVSLLRLQELPGDFSLLARLYGQWSNRNLDSSEDFALGGPHGVRGWAVSEGRGDTGFLGTLELRNDLPAPSAWGHLQAATFIDAGRVSVNEEPKGIASLDACGCNGYDLASAGVSLRWAHPRGDITFSWAHGFGGNPGRSAITGTNADGTNDEQQLWLRGAIRF